MTNNHSIISGWIELSPGLVGDWNFPQFGTTFEVESGNFVEQLIDQRGVGCHGQLKNAAW